MPTTWARLAWSPTPWGGLFDDSDFYPSGGERPVYSFSGNNYKFTGKERDTESGLDHFLFRQYASSLGRFTIPDPENAGVDRDEPQSWNGYAYVNDNPTNMIDPTGLFPWGIFGGGWGGGFGGIWTERPPIYTGAPLDPRLIINNWQNKSVWGKWFPCAYKNNPDCRVEKVLLARFPELRELVEETFGSYYDLKTETPEAYPVFEDVLQGLVFELLETGKDDPLLRRIFSFFEEMGNSQDKEIVNLLWIAILEPLVSDPARIGRAWNYMGERTRELARETARSGGWEENLPPFP